MTPSELRQFLQSRPQATLAEMALHFQASPDAIQAAMTLWLSKGKATVTQADGCASGCCKCGTAHLTVYRWVD